MLKKRFCLEGTVNCNVDAKVNSVEGLGRKEESDRESLYHFRENMHYHEENIDRNMDIKGLSGEVPE